MYLFIECCSLGMEGSMVGTSQFSIATALALCSLHARIAVCSAEQQKQLQYLWLYPMHFYSACMASMQINNILFCSCAKCWRMWRCMVEYDDVLYRLAFGWPSSGTLFGPIALLIGLRPVIQFQHKYTWYYTQILFVFHENTFGMPYKYFRYFQLTILHCALLTVLAFLFSFYWSLFTSSFLLFTIYCLLFGPTNCLLVVWVGTCNTISTSTGSTTSILWY